MSHGLLTLKRGMQSHGSRFVRDMERLGATDAWDFVNQSYLRAGRVTAPGLTVTRASSGYAETSDGRLIEFGSGVLRRTDRGVLVEGARTNLCLQSQTFDNAAWIKYADGTASAPVVTANAALAPDGTMTADSVVFNRGAGNTLSDMSDLSQSISTSAGSHFGTVWLKAASAGDVGKQIGVRHVGSSSYTVYTLTADWVRFGHAETNVVGRFDITNRGTITADNTVTVLVWGAQLEAAAFPSSYIKTEASTVTRAADQITASLPSVAYPASLYAEFVRNGDTGAAEGVFQVDALSRAQRANINVSSTDTLSVTARGGANDGDAAVSGAVAVGAITKGAGRIVVNDLQAARAGALATEDTTASVPTSAPDTVRFGDFGATATYGFLYIRRAAIIPTALSNTQLQEIST